MSIGYILILFLAKVLDNALSTAKQILIQRNKSILAAISIVLSNFIYLSITKDVITSDSSISMVIVSLAAGVGCYLAVSFNDRFSKDKTYVNVIMSDDIEAMKELRDFLAQNKVTNTASDSYTLDWSRKTIAITAYAETKEQSKLIDEYLEASEVKFKRMVQGKRIK